MAGARHLYFHRKTKSFAVWAIQPLAMAALYPNLENSMKPRLISAISLSLCLLAPASIAQPNKASAQADQFSGGTFRRTDPSPSVMTIVKRGANWRMAITGGGIPRGESSAADCSLLAEGQLNNGQIQAKLIPFKNDDMEIDADDLKASPGVVVVKLTPSGAVVTQATVDPFCGVGSMLTGIYRKAR